MTNDTGPNQEISHAVVIGTSAGGVDALPRLLAALPASFRWPILLVIHLERTRESRLAESLDRRCAIRVKEADNMEEIRPGTVYLAPRNYHLLVEDTLHLALAGDEPVSFSRPSVDVLFASAADVFQRNLIGVILTGANADGAQGLQTVKAMGGTTIVQTPAEAKFSAMPEAALKTGAVDHVLPLTEIGPLLVRLQAKQG